MFRRARPFRSQRAPRRTPRSGPMARSRSSSTRPASPWPAGPMRSSIRIPAIPERRVLRLPRHGELTDGQRGDAHDHGSIRDQDLWLRRPDDDLHRHRLPASRYGGIGADLVLTAGQAGTLAGEQAGQLRHHPGHARRQANYTISFTGSTLTITPAPLTVAANPQTKVYGTAIPP